MKILGRRSPDPMIVFDKESNVAPYAHCNPEVVHAPGTCKYCDLDPDRQQARISSRTPFTPAEANGWMGNIAVPPDEEKE